MIQRQVTICNKLGLHARAASKFVTRAAAFSSQIRLGPEGGLVDGKSIMSLMMLAAGRGATLQLQAEGADEESAMAALLELIENRFDEDE